MSRYLSKFTLGLVTWAALQCVSMNAAAAGEKDKPAAAAAPSALAICENQELVKAVMNLVVQVNKIDAKDLSFELANFQLAGKGDVKVDKPGKQDVYCKAHLTLKQAEKVVESVDLVYGQIVEPNAETKVFFNPVRK